MFLTVFKALFTEFCNCACAKKIVMLIRISHTCVALLHKKTVLSLKTSSDVNFEFIKFVKKGKCLPSTKTNREGILDSYFMPVCSIVKTITPRCRGRPEALLHEAECNSASGRPWYPGVIV